MDALGSISLFYVYGDLKEQHAVNEQVLNRPQTDFFSSLFIEILWSYPSEPHFKGYPEGLSVCSDSNDRSHTVASPPLNNLQLILPERVRQRTKRTRKKPAMMSD